MSDHIPFCDINAIMNRIVTQISSKLDTIVRELTRKELHRELLKAAEMLDSPPPPSPPLVNDNVANEHVKPVSSSSKAKKRDHSSLVDNEKEKKEEEKKSDTRKKAKTKKIPNTNNNNNNNTSKKPIYRYPKCPGCKRNFAPFDEITHMCKSCSQSENVKKMALKNKLYKEARTKTRANRVLLVKKPKVSSKSNSNIPNEEEEEEEEMVITEGEEEEEHKSDLADLGSHWSNDNDNDKRFSKPVKRFTDQDYDSDEAADAQEVDLMNCGDDDDAAMTEKDRADIVASVQYALLKHIREGWTAFETSQWARKNYVDVLNGVLATVGNGIQAECRVIVRAFQHGTFRYGPHPIDMPKGLFCYWCKLQPRPCCGYHVIDASGSHCVGSHCQRVIIAIGELYKYLRRMTENWKKPKTWIDQQYIDMHQKVQILMKEVQDAHAGR